MKDNMTTEETKKCTYTYYSFGGADTTVYMNNTALSSVQGIKYDTIKKELLIESVSFFNSNDKKTIKVCEDYNLMISLKNEKLKILSVTDNGLKRFREIRGVNYVGEKGSLYIDDLVHLTTYVFSFEEITPPIDINSIISAELLIETSDELFNMI